MITDENEFLGAIIKCKDENNDVDISALFSETRMKPMDCKPFLDSLKRKGMIEFMDFETIHINPIAFSAYKSPARKAAKSVFHISARLLKFVVIYILGIASGLVVAYITYKFGWQ